MIVTGARIAAESKAVRRRLAVLELADRLGNISEACRRRGMTRTQYYEYKKRYEILGLEGLADQPPIAKSHPQTTPATLVAKICKLALAHPSCGCNYLAQLQGPKGVRVSAVTIQKILNEHELGTRRDRWLALERQYAEVSTDLNPEQLTYLEQHNAAFRERHVESSKPGELLCHGDWSIGHVKGVGEAYLHSVVDTFNGFAFGFLHLSNTPDVTAALLHDHVLPFYREHGLRVESVLTNSRPEFCGRPPHPYRAYLALNWVQHRMLHGRRRPPNGFLVRFRQSVNGDFFAARPSARRYVSLATRQIDLDHWLHTYNYELPYLGYPNQGLTPYARMEQYLANLPLVGMGTTKSGVNIAG